MKPLKELLEKILLQFPNINRSRIVYFREKIHQLKELFYDEIETMRYNEFDIIMDHGIDVDQEENISED